MTQFLVNIIPKVLLQYFPADKILHFFVSFVLLFVFFWIRKYFLKEEWFLRIFAFSFRDVIVVWILKEIFDSLWFWNPEFMDLVADFSWIIIPIYLFFIVKLSSQLKNSEKLQFEKDLILHFTITTSIITKSKIFIKLWIIWFLNIFYLLIKIPILALDQTYVLLVKLLKKM